MYRPPNSTADFLDKFQRAIDDIHLATSNHQRVIVTSDFNVDWANPYTVNMRNLTRIVSAMDLTQLVDAPIRQCPHEPDNGAIYH